MVLSKIRVSQNFCEISRVSQSRFLGGCQHLRVSNFCKVVSDYRSQSRILKVKKSRARKEKRQSRRLAKSRFYRFATRNIILIKFVKCKFNPINF